MMGDPYDASTAEGAEWAAEKERIDGLGEPAQAPLDVHDIVSELIEDGVYTLQFLRESMGTWLACRSRRWCLVHHSPPGQADALRRLLVLSKLAGRAAPAEMKRECSVCFTAFDRGARLPHTLPCSTHLVCKRCVSGLSSCRTCNVNFGRARPVPNAELMRDDGVLLYRNCDSLPAFAVNDMKYNRMVLRASGYSHFGILETLEFETGVSRSVVERLKFRVQPSSFFFLQPHLQAPVSQASLPNYPNWARAAPWPTPYRAAVAIASWLERLEAIDHRSRR